MLRAVTAPMLAASVRIFFIRASGWNGLPLTIPMAALSTDQAGPYAFVIDADGTAHQRRLKLGISRDGRIAITEGLKEGENVVVQGLQKVRDGAKVVAQPDTSQLSSNGNANDSQGERK